MAITQRHKPNQCKPKTTIVKDLAHSHIKNIRDKYGNKNIKTTPLVEQQQQKHQHKEKLLPTKSEANNDVYKRRDKYKAKRKHVLS